MLLILDRVYRIEPFTNGSNSIQCGVGMPSCINGTKCLNGYCETTNPPNLKPTMLPVFP